MGEGGGRADEGDGGSVGREGEGAVTTTRVIATIGSSSKEIESDCSRLAFTEVQTAVVADGAHPSPVRVATIAAALEVETTWKTTSMITDPADSASATISRASTSRSCSNALAKVGKLKSAISTAEFKRKVVAMRVASTCCGRSGG